MKNKKGLDIVIKKAEDFKEDNLRKAYSRIFLYVIENIKYDNVNESIPLTDKVN